MLGKTYIFSDFMLYKSIILFFKSALGVVMCPAHLKHFFSRLNANHPSTPLSSFDINIFAVSQKVYEP